MTDAGHDLFLQNLRSGMDVRKAARRAGVSLGVLYRRRRRDAGFGQAWREAEAVGRDRPDVPRRNRRHRVRWSRTCPACGSDGSVGVRRGGDRVPVLALPVARLRVGELAAAVPGGLPGLRRAPGVVVQPVEHRVHRVRTADPGGVTGRDRTVPDTIVFLPGLVSGPAVGDVTHGRRPDVHHPLRG